MSWQKSQAGSATDAGQRWLGWTLLIAAVTGLAILGAWQVLRGLQKQHLQQAFASALAAPSVRLTKETPLPQLGMVQAVVATGNYDSTHTLLSANQWMAGRRGYEVWTPFKLAGGGTVYVDRGWQAAEVLEPKPGSTPVIRKAELSPPAGPVTVSGLLRALPRPGWRFAKLPCQWGEVAPVWLFPSIDELSCGLASAPLAAVLLLDAQADGGWLRQWQAPLAFPPERHYGYAAQWFALALTLALLGSRQLRRKLKVGVGEAVVTGPPI